MKSVYFVRILASVLLFFNSAIALGQASAKPNIVLIYTDDQAWYTIHALGNKEIQTPNMDRLAKMGRAFLNAYNMGAWHGAVCVASRSMMMTGRTLWNVKQLEDDKRLNDVISQTWAKLMEKAGYSTFMTGKWHISMDPHKVFQVATDIRPGMAAYATPPGAKLPGYVSNKNLNIPGYNRPQRPADDTWSPYDISFGGLWAGGTHWSVRYKQESIALIKQAQKQGKPFFLYLASNAPHDPRQSPKEYIDQYPLNRISIPKSFLPEYPYKDGMGNGPSLRDEALAPFPRTQLAIKTHTQEYYAAITFLDKQIGEILDALEATGQMGNTYIFFTADHGLAMGRHGLMGKQSLFEHSMKPPLIIAGPGIPKNTTCYIPVYLQDIMATSLELAGIPKPDYVEFRSFLKQAKGTSTQKIHEAIYGGYMNLQRAVRVGNYKLIVYPEINKMLLFNLEKDPEEMQDLAASKDHRPVLSKLYNELIKQQKQLNDPLQLASLDHFIEK
ncbi:sulfatase-like hydrolase/transferase [Niabella hirudinis]|uniref:sulfatase-like hydrolase/transferase n=1 Tax=Niabella hirudinis TaxID=1285929 RepID=UPI003EBA7360